MYEYLKTNYWKNLRKKLIYDKKNVKCAGCGYKKDKTKLHLHHKDYSFVFREIKADLIVLCEKCHVFLEDYRKNFGGEKMPFWYLHKLKLGKIKNG